MHCFDFFLTLLCFEVRCHMGLLGAFAIMRNLNVLNGNKISCDRRHIYVFVILLLILQLPVDVICIGCETGYYSKNEVCLLCPKGCSSCTSEMFCTSCKKGHFNQSCSTQCSANCSNTQCDNTSDGCIKCESFPPDKLVCIGCPENCEACDSTSDCLACNVGFKGETCQQECSNCKTNTRCRKSNGYCFDGCKDGFSGNDCNLPCDTNCKRCDRIARNICIVCFDKRYGNNCDRCSFTCLNESCDPVDGFCTNGCENGNWGNKCEHICSSQCLNNSCDRESGTCTRGCIAGYMGIICSCSQNCNCNINGTCESCKDGFGEMCDQKCNEGCMHSLCRKENGECSDGCKDGYSGLYCIKDERSILSTITSIPVLVGMVTGVAAFGIILVLLVRIVIKRRKALRIRSEANNVCGLKNPAGEIILDMDSDIEEIDYYLHPTYYRKTEVEKMHPHVNIRKKTTQIRDLADYVANKTHRDFNDEFQELPSGFLKPANESVKRENLIKNRYKEIYPYDETRVVLKGSTSDYINASYIDGYKARKAYIASLGPSVKYMGEISTFWRMVWQEKCGKIVMLSKTHEHQVNKCDQYWPGSEYTDLFDQITVSTLNEISFPHYVERTFEVLLRDERRIITQLQFIAWPGKWEDEDVTNFVDFRQKVNDVRTDLNGPTLVHCSSGVGRTGTFIALDILTKEGEAEGCINIFGCVSHLREQRVKMVQNVQQYLFLHHSLVRSTTFYTQLANRHRDNIIYQQCQD